MNGGGTVFTLSQSGGVWTSTTLFAFVFDGWSTGFYPNSKVAFDNAGNIYGTTTSGGYGPCEFGCGMVYELSPSASGYTETLVHSFEDDDGHFPEGLIMYGRTLYGTCSEGGGGKGYGLGTVFDIVP